MLKIDLRKCVFLLAGPCNAFVAQNIKDILEELRPRMHLPIPRFNFPPLHPLFIEHISLDNFELLAGLEKFIFQLLPQWKFKRIFFFSFRLDIQLHNIR